MSYHLKEKKKESTLYQCLLKVCMKEIRSRSLMQPHMYYQFPAAFDGKYWAGILAITMWLHALCLNVLIAIVQVLKIVVAWYHMNATCKSAVVFLSSSAVLVVAE